MWQHRPRMPWPRPPVPDPWTPYGLCAPELPTVAYNHYNYRGSGGRCVANDDDYGFDYGLHHGVGSAILDAWYPAYMGANDDAEEEEEEEEEEVDPLLFFLQTYEPAPMLVPDSQSPTGVRDVRVAPVDRAGRRGGRSAAAARCLHNTGLYGAAFRPAVGCYDYFVDVPLHRYREQSEEDKLFSFEAYERFRHRHDKRRVLPTAPPLPAPAPWALAAARADRQERHDAAEAEAKRKRRRAPPPPSSAFCAPGSRRYASGRKARAWYSSVMRRTAHGSGAVPRAVMPMSRWLTWRPWAPYRTPPPLPLAPSHRRRHRGGGGETPQRREHAIPQASTATATPPHLHQRAGRGQQHYQHEQQDRYRYQRRSRHSEQQHPEALAGRMTAEAAGTRRRGAVDMSRTPSSLSRMTPSAMPSIRVWETDAASSRLLGGGGGGGGGREARGAIGGGGDAGDERYGGHGAGRNVTHAVHDHLALPADFGATYASTADGTETQDTDEP